METRSKAKTSGNVPAIAGGSSKSNRKRNKKTGAAKKFKEEHTSLDSSDYDLLLSAAAATEKQIAADGNYSQTFVVPANSAFVYNAEDEHTSLGSLGSVHSVASSSTVDLVLKFPDKNCMEDLPPDFDTLRTTLQSVYELQSGQYKLEWLWEGATYVIDDEKTYRKAANKMGRTVVILVSPVATLADGMPPFYCPTSEPKGHIPAADRHAPCSVTLKEFPNLVSVPSKVACCGQPQWIGGTKVIDGVLHIHCGNEADIVDHHLNYMRQIVHALGLDLHFSHETTVQQIRSDIIVVYKRQTLVGTFEYKVHENASKPRAKAKGSKGILEQPTVIGQSLDQMLALQALYGVGPILGVLVTGNEMRVNWFERDHAAIAGLSLSKSPALTDQVSSSHPPVPVTPAFDTMKKQSPPRNPSQKLSSVHDVYQEVAGVDGNRSAPLARHLFSTRVLSMRTEPLVVLQHLVSVLLVMSEVRTNYTSLRSTTRMYFLRDMEGVSFHEESSINIATLDWDNFPAKNTKRLVVLKDLHRSSNSQAWLCCTQKLTAVCVVKFDNFSAKDSSVLKHEFHMWQKLYPVYDQVRLEKWSGSIALLLPHFNFVPVDRRSTLKRVILAELERFQSKGYCHTDIKWNHIGVSQSGIVLLELDCVQEWDGQSEWIVDAMMYLYPDDNPISISTNGSSCVDQEIDMVSADLLDKFNSASTN